MPRDPAKAKARKQRYLERQKVKKFGPDAAGKDLRGKHGKQVKGPDHPRWNGARMLSQDGYVKIRVGKGHPLGDPNGYAYEHELVWATSGRPPIQPDEVIHHRDETKTNNQIENLEAKTRTAHSIEHHSSLTDAQVRAIREQYAAGAADMPTLAAQFGVPFQRISKLVRGDTRISAGGPIIKGDKRRGRH